MARIVIVEDEVIVARSIAKMLGLNGHEVPACVTTGADAIAAAASLRPELILMDIHLRGPMDGIEASERIRRDSDVPIVFLTAYGDRDHLERAMQAAPHGYLIKPYSDRDLLATVEVALHKHGLERELAERERWLGTVLRSLGEGVIALGPDQRILSMNAMAEQMTGWSDAEALGRPVTEVLPLRAEAGGAERVLPLARAMAERVVLGLEGPTLLHTRDGREVPVDYSVSPIVDDQAGVRGAVVIVRDVAERRVLENRLAVSARLASLATLTAGMGHQLNNPLTYNLGNLELALEDLQDVRAGVPGALDAVERCLRDALDGARRMRDVLGAMEELARGDSAERHVVSIATCLDLALRLAGNEIAQRGRLVRDERARPLVEGQEGRLVQVFSNLLLNAAQALPERSAEGEVHILVEQTATHAVIEIGDTGAGIPADVMVRIFEPFFTTKPVGVGTGLGLPIAHGIVRQHGGDITVRSKPGEGATFRVELPLATAAAAAAPPPPRPEVERRLRVLLVDDDPLVLRLFGALIGEDHDVVLAASGREALARIDVDPPDVIVTDLMMPEMTGVELHAAVKERDAALAARMLFVTGGAFTPSAQAFVTAMADRVLFKPVAPADLLAAVADLAP